MRRVMIIGGPGSGKSTVARALGRRLGLPVVHLDQLHHLPGWTPRPPAEFRRAVEEAAALPAWIIDGNYLSTAGPRLGAADTLIYLHAPRWLAMTRVIRRTLIGYGRQRPDAPPGCVERFDADFLRFVWHWHRDTEPRVRAMREGFVGRYVELPSGRAVARFLVSLPRA